MAGRARTRCSASSASPTSARRRSACRRCCARAASTRTRSPPSSPARCSRRCGNCCADSSARTTTPKGELLAEVLRESPHEVYGGLLSTLMRLVFVLYAEDRGLMPAGDVYQRHYSVSGLFERLREDAGALSGHDGRALRRVGAAAGAVPAHSRRRRARRPAVSARGTAGCSIRTRIRSSKAARSAATAAWASSSIRRASPTASSSACCRTC